MLGSEDNQIKGLYILAVGDIFNILKKPAFANITVVCSFYEIYGGKLFDLLSERKQILCREDGNHKINIVGLTKIKCKNANELMNVIQKGNNARSSGMTGANDNSSRSHAILTIDLKTEPKENPKSQKKSKFQRFERNSNKNNVPSVHGRLSFIGKYLSI